MKKFTQLDVTQGRVCSYCGSKPKLVSDTQIYGRSYGGSVWLCKCGAYVSAHKDTGEPMGMLAKPELHALRQEVHFYFDQLWKMKYYALPENKRNIFAKRNCRRDGYKWLANKMGKLLEFTHVGMFNERECIKAIKICKPYAKYKTYSKDLKNKLENL